MAGTKARSIDNTGTSINSKKSDKSVPGAANAHKKTGTAATVPVAYQKALAGLMFHKPKAK